MAPFPLPFPSKSTPPHWGISGTGHLDDRRYSLNRAHPGCGGEHALGTCVCSVQLCLARTTPLSACRLACCLQKRGRW